jgi:hypothetical protein
MLVVRSRTRKAAARIEREDSERTGQDETQVPVRTD